MEILESIRAAVPPTAARPTTPAASLDTIDGWAAGATAMQARLLVLPQAFLTDGIGGVDRAGQGALLSDGPELVALASIARRHGVAIACGYVEQCSGRFHDSALFVDHRGCALANYRRTHFVPDREPDLLAEGHWLTVVPFAGRKLGLLIGPDIEVPEPARALALAGADSLLVLAAHGPDAAIVGEVVLPARAYENGCAIVYA
ncbi:MAG: nitrilase-related carbon-nitrogen hydrolase, partial [Geminicoccaceae bacterium]